MRFAFEYIVAIAILLAAYLGFVAPKVKERWPRFSKYVSWILGTCVFIFVALFEYFTEVEITKAAKKIVGDTVCYIHTVSQCPAEIRAWAQKREAERTKAVIEAEAVRKEAQRIRAANDEAKARLEDEQARQRAAERTKAAIEAEAARKEAQRNRAANDEAKARLEDEQAWQRAAEVNTLMSYYYYLYVRPNGKYALIARQRLDTLDNSPRRMSKDILAEELNSSTWMHCELGRAYARVDEHEKAIAAYSIAIKLEPGLSLAYAGRASSLERVGNEIAALDDFRRAFELDAQNAEAMQGIQRLSRTK